MIGDRLRHDYRSRPPTSGRDRLPASSCCCPPGPFYDPLLTGAEDGIFGASAGHHQVQLACIQRRHTVIRLASTSPRCKPSPCPDPAGGRTHQGIAVVARGPAYRRILMPATAGRAPRSPATGAHPVQNLQAGAECGRHRWAGDAHPAGTPVPCDFGKAPAGSGQARSIGGETPVKDRKFRLGQQHGRRGRPIAAIRPNTAGHRTTDKVVQFGLPVDGAPRRPQIRKPPLALGFALGRGKCPCLCHCCRVIDL